MKKYDAVRVKHSQIRSEGREFPGRDKVLNKSTEKERQGLCDQYVTCVNGEVVEDKETERQVDLFGTPNAKLIQ